MSTLGFEGSGVVLDDDLLILLLVLFLGGFDYHAAATGGDFNLVSLLLDSTLGLESRFHQLVLVGGEARVGVSLHLVALLGQELHQRRDTDVQFGSRFF